MSDKSSKTEEATPKRLSDSRKKGQVAKSPDLSSAASLFAFTLATSLLGQYTLSNSKKLLRSSLSMSFKTNLSRPNVGTLLLNSMFHYALLLLPFALIAIVVGVVSNLGQTGFMFVVEPLKPDFKKLNPIEGFKNIFSKKAAFDLVKNILKLTLVFYITYRNLSDSVGQILNVGSIGTEKIFYFMMDFAKDLCMNIGIIMLVLAVADYVFQRYEHKKNLRMSIQEIKDEYKDMEGDPQVKSMRQQRQREISAGRMMENIESSTVVITNPTHIAIVLRYDSEIDGAPIITAKGKGTTAEKIRQVAKEHDVPIIENKPLAREMYPRVEIGDYVPMELYQAIAEILAMVFEMKEKQKGKI